MTNRNQDPYNRINGDPPRGMTWTLIEHDSNRSRASGIILCQVQGSEPETPEEKKARLLREAAGLIRQGTQLSSPIGSKELREGLIRIAEALEVETE